MLISFMNQKGGVGKSTACILLGAVLKIAGYKVCFDDLDPQGTVSYWSKLTGDIPMREESDQPDVILCDTPGRLDLEDDEKLAALNTVIQQSHRLAVICEKSPFSIQASKAMCDYILRTKTEESKAFILFNKVRTNTVVGKQAHGDLAFGLGISALENFIPLAAPFENMQMQGISAIQGKHREIILKLALEILK